MEAKAILAVRPELRRTDDRSLGEFVACGCVLENRTLFEDIHVLPSASAWTFGPDRSRPRKHISSRASGNNKNCSTRNPIIGKSVESFSRRFPRYLNGHEQIGVSLTGGLDTRTVMAWQRFPPRSLPCYTYGGIDRECRDVVMARRIAQECSSPIK